MLAIVAAAVMANQHSLAQDAEALQRVRDAVFQIQVLDPAGEPVSSGTGFLADRPRLAITNFHVVEDAASVRLVFNDGHAVEDCELWQVFPDWDLAVLRLPETFTRRSDTPTPLSLRLETPVEGMAVLAAGFPMGYGYTLTQGIASGIRVQRDLPLGEYDAFDPDMVWIQTDAAMNPGNSGGPLVLGDGVVVGVNSRRHMSIGGVRLDSFYFAVAGQHAIRALEGLPAQPVGFGSFERREPAARPVPIAFPSVEIDAATHPLQVVRDARTAAQSLRCRGCLGNGTQVELVRGQERRGKQLWQTGEERRRACSACAGLGVDQERPSALLRRLARVASTVDRDHERFGELAGLLALQFEDAWKVRNLSSREAFRRATRTIAIADAERRVGAPTALAVFAVRPLRLEGAGTVLLGLQADGTPVVLTQPVALAPNDMESGYGSVDFALAGGVFAGTIDLPDVAAAGGVPVVQNAFVVSPP